MCGAGASVQRSGKLDLNVGQKLLEVLNSRRAALRIGDVELSELLVRLQ